MSVVCFSFVLFCQTSDIFFEKNEYSKYGSVKKVEFCIKCDGGRV